MPENGPVCMHEANKPARTVIRFIPVNTDDALKLAGIVADYNPIFLIRDIAQTAGFREIPLHHAWISSLLDAGIGILAGSATVVSMKINHCRFAVQEMPLLLEIIRDCESAIVFKISDDKGLTVAYGNAELKI